MARILFLLASLPLLATFAPRSLQHREPPPAVTLLAYTPVPLEEGDPGRDRLGRLRFLGGWAVTSNDARLGGISALHVEGGEALALSDAGWRIRLPLPGSPGPLKADIAMIREGPGPAGDKVNRDVESVAVADGEAWLAFEQFNAVWRYDRTRFVARASARPAAMAEWSDNAGPEAMVRLPDGRFLIFAEGQGGDSEALLFAGDPAVRGTRALRLRYRPPRGYRVTDAALLPDGRLILLNRSIGLFSGFTAKLVAAAIPEPVPDALIQGEEVASFEGRVSRDNFEALSVGRDGGRTILWLASDDNYNPLQRTLLLKFALEE